MQREELKKLHLKIFKYFKNKATSLEGGQSSELKKYLSMQKKISLRPYKSISYDRMLVQIAKAQVILIADFHTFDQNIRTVLRILRHLVKNNEKPVLALEMVHYECQLAIDAYMGKHITELEFLESINYLNSWKFPWSHYKLLFDFAKKNKLQIRGINSFGNLKKRDDFAAKQINEIALESAGEKILVLFGELHICQDKIPDKLNKINSQLKQVIIHQNLDEVYWKLKSNFQELEITQFRDNEFCVLTSPPWVKYESMIYWYENLQDDCDYDIHEYIITNGKKLFSDDTFETLINICNELNTIFHLDLEKESIEDININDHTGIEFIEDSIANISKKSLHSLYEHLLISGHSFKLPSQNTFYCSSYSLNRLSYLSGLHIQSIALDQLHFNELKILSSRNKLEKISFFILQSMWGHFFSKVINPHRKCDLYGDLKIQAKTSTNKQLRYELEVALSLLNNKSNQIDLAPLRLIGIYRVGHYVGHILGDYMLAHMTASDSNSPEIKSLLKKAPTYLLFQEVRSLLLANVEYKNHFKRQF